MDSNTPSAAASLRAARYAEPAGGRVSTTIRAAEQADSESKLPTVRIDPPTLAPGGSLDDASQGAGLERLSLEQAAALVERQRPARFRFLRRLGEGAMGTVFLVYDADFEIHVAIKIVRDRRAKREGRATAGLTDPHLVGIREMIACGAYFAHVMPYVEGIPLDEAFNARKLEPDFPTLMHIAKELAGALASLHAANVVHRDLKGANVLITKTGAIRLLDFGLGVVCGQRLPAPGLSRSACESPSVLTRSVAGTPTTMAPEQVYATHEVGPHSDIYAFGATFYEFATGRPPHDCADANEMLRMKRTPVAPLAPKRPDLPQEFCALVDACLTIAWRHRIRNGATLQEKLLEVEAQTKHAAPLMPAKVPPWWRRKAPLAVAVALLGLTSAVAVGQQRRAGMAASVAASEIYARAEGKPVPTPDRVAVVGFETQDSRLDANAAMAAERLATAIELDGPLVIHRNDAMRGEIEKKIGNARARKDAASLAALSTAGVRYALLGTMRGDTSRVTARLELVDMMTAATVASIDAHASEARFFEMMDRLDEEVRHLLSLRALDADSIKPIRRVLPPEPNAAREYALALDLLGRGEVRAARGKLVAISGTGAVSHARTHVLIAELNHQLGAEEEAKRYADGARSLANSLPERERLPIEARADLASGNAAAAVAKLKALGLAHRSIETIDRLVEASHEAIKYEDGEAALRELEVFGDAFSHDPHLAQMRAALAWARGDTESTLTFARQAAAFSGERIAVRAQAKRYEARALYVSVGATPEANAASEEAVGLLLAIDNTRDAASLYIARGDAKYNGMDFAGAIEEYRAGLQMKGTSSSSIADDFLERITSAEWKLGHHADAERMFEALVAKKNISEFARGYAYLLGAAGAREQGHLGHARARLENAKRILRDKMPVDQMFTMIEEAALERARGRVLPALKLAREAFHIASSDAKDFKADAANALGWAYLADRQVRNAGKMFALAHASARLRRSRIDEAEACKGISRMPSRTNEEKELCRE